MANGSDTGSLCFEQTSSIEMLIFNAPIDCTFCGLPSSESASISGSASFSNRRVGWPNRPVQWAVAVYGQLQQQQQQRGHAYFIRQILGAPLKLLATPPRRGPSNALAAVLLLHPDYIQWELEFMWFGQSIYYIASQFRRCQLRTKYPICVYEFYFDYKTTANYDDVLWNIQWKRLTGFLQLPLSLPFPIIIRSNLPACRNPFPADIAHALPTAVLFAVLVRL